VCKEGKTNGRAMDRPTGMTELTVDFCSFANAPKMDISMEILAVTYRELFTKQSIKYMKHICTPVVVVSASTIASKIFLFFSISRNMYNPPICLLWLIFLSTLVTGNMDSRIDITHVINNVSILANIRNILSDKVLINV
jgi:hypothetical protein